MPASPIEQKVLLYDATGNPLLRGQKTMAESLPVVIAADQTTLPTEEQLHTKNPVHFNVEFANGATVNMNANGSIGTPVNFSIGPAVGETWYVNALVLFFQATGAPDFTDFGLQAGGLANGVQFIQKVGVTEYVMALAKINIDLLRLFPVAPQNLTRSSFGNAIDYYQGIWDLPKPIRLRQSNGDSMTVRIRDNISAGVLDHFRVSAQFLREV